MIFHDIYRQEYRSNIAVVLNLQLRQIPVSNVYTKLISVDACPPTALPFQVVLQG
jgi:hypothetical protein